MPSVRTLCVTARIQHLGEGKRIAGSGIGAGGGGGIFLNNRAYQGGKGSSGMVYIEYSN